MGVFSAICPIRHAKVLSALIPDAVTVAASADAVRTLLAAYLDAHE